MGPPGRSKAEQARCARTGRYAVDSCESGGRAGTGSRPAPPGPGQPMTAAPGWRETGPGRRRANKRGRIDRPRSRVLTCAPKAPGWISRDRAPPPKRSGSRPGR
ncbi:hypothetical protein [Lysobacter gummosus]|uniref:hypothetical protein n=1 Tax=Lysobacter gummosus TaxID=262324 RepID=UPI00363CCBC2